MRERPNCRCPLCLIDRQLRLELFDAANENRQRTALHSLPHLSSFATSADLLSHLQSSKANAETDVILSELLAVKARFTDGTATTLFVLLFLPVLHSTVRQVRQRYPSLSCEDIVQQALGALLDFLDSPYLRLRQTYLAFAIARRVRRATFEWATKEVHNALEGRRSDFNEGKCLTESAGESFERAAFLRHLLGRALVEGVLSSSELDLLIHFKLEGGGDNGAFSNAERQRLKRLVAKLRKLANGRKSNRP